MCGPPSHGSQPFPAPPADVSITHLTFSREYTNAVEAKQVAQQEAERAKYIGACVPACVR